MQFKALKQLKNKDLTPIVSNFYQTDCIFSNFSILQNKYLILPGFCDVHVHFREPGFSYKETIKTGSMSASRGGYTTVFTMPNLNPVPDCKANLDKQLELIDKNAVIEVIPYGSITKRQQGKELSNFEEMANYVCAFSDDGKGVQEDSMMEKAMLKAKEVNKIIVAHCEVNALLEGGYIHKGEYAKAHNHRGICSASEYAQIERDIALAKKTGAKYHVCHISTKESVDLIRKAKRDGVDVTCETAPHYLILSDRDLQEDGRFKMNPPLRSEEDKKALIEGVIDGTIDMIATDHAPHSLEEKSKGLEKSAFGIVGLETAFALLYTHLVKKGVITIEKLIDLLCYNPRKRFNLPVNEQDFTIFEVEKEYKIDPEEFLSMGKSTPFENESVYGKCMLTVCDGEIVYQE